MVPPPQPQPQVPPKALPTATVIATPVGGGDEKASAFEPVKGKK